MMNYAYGLHLYLRRLRHTDGPEPVRALIQPRMMIVVLPVNPSSICQGPCLA